MVSVVTSVRCFLMIIEFTGAFLPGKSRKSPCSQKLPHCQRRSTYQLSAQLKQILAEHLKWYEIVPIDTSSAIAVGLVVKRTFKKASIFDIRLIFTVLGALYRLTSVGEALTFCPNKG